MRASAVPHRLAAFRSFVVLAFAFALAACTMQLAPSYDAGLHDGLVAANHDALVLFARVEDGAPQADYPRYADAYAASIADFEALRARAAARPMPQLVGQLKRLKFMPRVCGTIDIGECLRATDHALGTVTETLRGLRAMHHRADLTPETVKLLRGQYDQAIDQALTVETALKR